MDDNEKAIFDYLLVMTEAMAGLKARLDEHDTRAASLAQRLALIERRITAQGDSMSYRIANAADLAATNFKKIAAIEQHGGSLAQRCEMRIAAIEQRLADLEEPQGYPDDVRDALRALDELSATETTRLPGLWKLDNFPPMNGKDGE